MAQFSYEEYEKQLTANSQNQGQKSAVQYFGLKNDGDEAVVRFCYSTFQDIQVNSIHVVTVDNKQRKVSCVRTLLDPLDKCPLCASGESVYQKIFVKLVEYVKNPDGTVVAMPRIWERAAAGKNDFAKKLKSLIAEYGDISDMVFKIKRYGEARSTQTTYEVIPANPSIYRADIYKKDFSGFDNYSLSKYVVLDKTADEMNTYLATGSFPSVENNEKHVQANTNSAVSEPTQPRQREVYNQDAAPASAVNTTNTAPGVANYTPAPETCTNTEPATPTQPAGYSTDYSRPRRYTY